MNKDKDKPYKVEIDFRMGHEMGSGQVAAFNSRQEEVAGPTSQQEMDGDDMTLEALEFESSESTKDVYSIVTGADRDIVSLLHRCSECNAAILVCDNGWLDAKALEPDDKEFDYGMGIMKMSGLALMAGGGGEGSRFTMHEHMPERFS